jgi:hypothetical protein
LHPQHTGPSPDLDRLIEELRRRENEHGMSTPSQGRRPRFFP